MSDTTRAIVKLMDQLAELKSSMDDGFTEIKHEMSQTNHEMSQMKHEIAATDRRLSALEETVRSGFASVDANFQKLDQKFSTQISDVRHDLGARVNKSLDFAFLTDQGYFRNEKRIMDLERRFSEFESKQVRESEQDYLPSLPSPVREAVPDYLWSLPLSFREADPNRPYPTHRWEQVWRIVEKWGRE